MTAIDDLFDARFIVDMNDPSRDQLKMLREAFEEAYKETPLSGLAKGGPEAASRVEVELRKQYPDLRITVARKSGDKSKWTVDAEADSW